MRSLLFIALMFYSLASHAQDEPLSQIEDAFLKACSSSEEKTHLEKHPNGKKKLEILCEGKNEGTYRSWYEDGTPRAEGDFENQKLSGEWSRWYPNGQLKDQGVWKEGVPDGSWTHWYENGKTKAKMSFDQGKRDGDWELFQEEGTLKAEGEFEQDQKIGEWREWDALKSEFQIKDYGGKPSRWIWSEFRASTLFAFQRVQDLKGQSYSLGLSWNPYYRISSRLGLRGETAFSLLRGQAGSLFVLASLGPHLSFELLPSIGLALEGGPQIMTWTSGSTEPCLAINALVDMPRIFGSSFDFLSRVFIGYRRRGGEVSSDVYLLGAQVSL